MSLRREKCLVALVLLATLGGGFFFVADSVGGRTIAAPEWLNTPVDARMPLVPSFVWVYLSWYPATALVLLADRGTFRRAYLAYLIAFASCAAGYLLLPVSISRPSVPSQSGWSGAALALLYEFDPPRNVFPSFHAAIAAILMRVAARTRLAGIALTWFVLVCAACILTKQHYLLDVVAGIAVGIGALRMVDVAIRGISSAWPDPATRGALGSANGYPMRATQLRPAAPDGTTPDP